MVWFKTIVIAVLLDTASGGGVAASIEREHFAGIAARWPGGQSRNRHANCRKDVRRAFFRDDGRQ
jgi:hypothetical protein